MVVVVVMVTVKIEMEQARLDLNNKLVREVLISVLTERSS
jgi:hypothetical protein